MAAMMSDDFEKIVAAQENRLVSALERWAAAEIELLAGGRVWQSRGPGVHVRGESGTRKVEHCESIQAGFTSAEDAARGVVDELTHSWFLLGSKNAVLVWRKEPELTRWGGLISSWRFYVRWGIVRLADGEVVADGVEEGVS